MRKTTIILAGAFALIVAAWVGIGAAYEMLTVSPFDMFLSADPVVKLTMMLSVLAGLIGIVCALAKQRRAALILGLTAVGWGVLGALYNELMTQSAVRAVGGVSFATTAPSRMETLDALGLGLGLGLIAMVIADLRKAR